MSLHLRLTLSLLAVASLLALLGGFAIRESRAIEREAKALGEAAAQGRATPAAIERAAARIAAETAEARRAGAVVGVAAIALALLLGIVVGRSIARPLRELRHAADEIGRGNPAPPIDGPAHGEVGELATAFHRMAADLGRRTVSRVYLEKVFNTMTGALILVDPASRIRGVNRAALDLLGYAEPELVGEPLDRICPERDAANTGSVMRLSAEGQVRNADRNFVRRDGSVVPVSFSGSTLRDGQGRIEEFVCVAYDITERRRMEERLRASLADKELLLREVHHRVKNNLQVISSLLDLQSDCAADPGQVELLSESRNRIRSMALIHEQLYRADQLAAIDLRAYVEQLATHLFRSYGAADGRIAFRLRVEAAPLDLDRAIACGLLLTEAISNSLKHAFPGGRRGSVWVEFGQAGEETLQLRVGDDGRGMAPAEDGGRPGSLGLTLIRTMARQLRGELMLYRDRGTEYRIDFPREPRGGEATARA